MLPNPRLKLSGCGGRVKGNDLVFAPARVCGADNLGGSNLGRTRGSIEVSQNLRARAARIAELAELVTIEDPVNV